MRAPGLPSRPVLLACLVGLGLALGWSRAANAVGEEITDIRVLGNQRTEESTIRSVAGVSIGDTLEATTLDTVRERLNTAGLFADVNVWWEPHGAGVRVNIAVKDKFPWAPVPTGSWSANNKAIGLIFVHGNLFRRGKQLLIGGRLATVDSGAVLAYRDPAFFGTWIYWQLQAHAKREDIPEFQQTDSSAQFGPFRNTLLRAYGFEPALGIAWFRRVKTQVSWRIERVDVEKSYYLLPGGTEMVFDVPASQDVTVGMGRANVSFDFRAREHSVMTGTALGGGIDFGRPGFGGDLHFWRAGGGVEHGIKFFRSHNLVFSVGGTFGRNLPFWLENTAGGTNLRGYLYQQYRGDSQVRGEFEYHFPLFSIGSLDFRALGFYDVSAIWWQDLPATIDPNASFDAVRNTPDQRNFFVGPAGYQEGFSFRRDVHQSVGGGLRFFLRSVAVPLVGFDAGYSLEAQTWRFILIVGA